MTAATGRIAGPKPFAPLADEGGLKFYLAANVAPFRNWFLTVSPSTGYMSQAAANTPGQIAAGFADRDSDGSTSAGQAAMIGRWSFVSGFPNSTIANDAILSTDVAVPFYFVDNQTVGKKSNDSGNNRSLGGIALGLDEDNSAPIIWCNPIAWLLARGALIASAFPLANVTISDALASDTIAERAIVRPKMHGTITSIQFTGDAIAEDNTDYIMLTISKRDGAGGGAVVLGTYDSRAANNGAVTAFVPASFTLSVVAGALNLLETDIVTVTEGKGGAGKVVDGVVIVTGKVL